MKTKTMETLENAYIINEDGSITYLKDLKK